MKRRLHKTALRWSCRTRHTQGGAALIAAMLTVALVATLAMGAVWQQWRTVEVEQAQRSQQQMQWLLLGAQDWARLILREDANAGAVDHLSEPWALPLQEARLKSFLNAEAQADDPSLSESFLSGRISDLQGRINLANLVEGNKISAPWFEAASRLFNSLGLPPSALVQLVLQLQASAPSTAGSGTANPRALLAPTQLSDLRRFGLSEAMLQALAPHATWLPQRTTINLNTASAEVLMAVLGMDGAAAQTLVRQRANAHFKTVEAALQAAPPQAQANASLAGVSSRYFEVRGQLRLGTLSLEQLSILERDSGQIRVLSRHIGSLQSMTYVYADR